MANTQKSSALAVLGHKIRSRLSPWRGDRLLIYKYPPEPFDLVLEAGETLERFDALAQIEPARLAAMVTAFGSHFPAVSTQLFASAARLYVMWCGGELYGIFWVKSGRDIPHWYVNLAPDDILTYAAVTARGLRGSGKRPRFSHEVYRRERKDGAADIWADVLKSSTSGIRSVEKQNFRFVTEVSVSKGIFSRAIAGLRLIGWRRGKFV